MDSGDQKWLFYVMACINRTCGEKLPIKVISSIKKKYNPEEYEGQINQNQRLRIKLCQYRHGFGLRNQNQFHLCCKNRC
jgi:hypothetical protein